MNPNALPDTPSAPRRIPSYRRHRPSGQAVATFGGRDFYLGAFGSKASKAEYRRRLAEWLAAGSPTYTAPEPSALTVNDLILRYWKHVKDYYRPETREGTIAPTLRRLRKLYGPTPAQEFGPLALKAFQRALLDERIALADPKAPPRRLSRPYINRALQWVRRLFRWAVGEQLLPPSVLQALQAVDGLKIGRTDAPEPAPVRAVADAVVEATLPHLSTVVADMVRLQRLTGMRPGEVCRMTTGEIEATGEVWLYQPREHKTAHFGHSRSVPIGPKAQDILRRYLRQELAEPIFSPRAADTERRRRDREENRTPFTPSRLRRDAERARKPRRRLNDRYTTTNYAQAIRRACDDAGAPRWTPNQLRHSKATELRKRFGLDAAGAVLGHSKLETTQIYAERATELGAKVALATG